MPVPATKVQLFNTPEPEGPDKTKDLSNVGGNIVYSCWKLDDEDPNHIEFTPQEEST